MHQACSKRAFDGQVKKWRRELHAWDQSEDDPAGVALKEASVEPASSTEGGAGLRTEAGPVSALEGQARDVRLDARRAPAEIQPWLCRALSCDGGGPRGWSSAPRSSGLAAEPPLTLPGR